MTPIPSNIGSLSATPYVDAFTTGEILGFVVLIICTQIVITWIAVTWLKGRFKVYLDDLFRNSANEFLEHEFLRTIESREMATDHTKAILKEIRDRLPERM